MSLFVAEMTLTSTDMDVATHPLKHILFPHPKQLCLHPQGHNSNFVHKQGAAISQVKLSDFSAHGTGKGALFVTKQLRLPGGFQASR
jgi:hypothetical protein